MSAGPGSGSSEVARRPSRSPAVAGLLVAVLAATAMAGWVAQVPWMVQLFPGATAMVFANALSLFLLGGALSLTATRFRRQAAVQTGAGILSMLIGATVLMQYAYGLDLPLDLPALHRWFNHPGRMAPNTALAHVFAGLALVLMARAGTDRLALAALVAAFAVLVMGIVGLVTYRLRPELLFGWDAKIRMAIHTGAAFIALGTGIAAVTYRNHHLGAFFRQREALRIGLLAGGLMIVVGLMAGLAVFALLQERIDTTLRDGVVLAFRNRVDFINSEIQHSLVSARNMAARPGIQRELMTLRASPDDAAAHRFLSEAVRSFAQFEMTAARLRDARGQIVVDVGSQGAPMLAVKLAIADADDAFLTWDGSAIGVRARIPVRHNDILLGSIETVQMLPAVTRLLHDIDVIGATSEMLLCARTGQGVECFPTRREPRPFLLPEHSALSADLVSDALASQQGVHTGVDHHGNQVLAAYGSVSGLGAVLKVDLNEVYGPARRQLEVILLVLTALVGASILVLNSRVLPLVRRLARSETQFRGLLEAAPDAMVVSNEQGRIVLVNSQAEALLGYTRAELIGESVEILQPERFRAGHVDRREAFLRVPHRRPMSGALDLYARRKDGTEIPVEIGLSPLDTDHGMVVISTIRDISERLRQVEALRASEQRWQFALEGSGEGVWDWNLVTNEVFFSRQWKQMLGYDEGDISASLDEWDKRVHPEDKSGAYADINRHRNGETPVYQNEHRMRCKDGSYKWILDRGMIVSRDADGKPLRMIGTHTDITERKRAEETIRALSLVDDLTGLRNRRGFMTIADAELRLAQRTGQRLSLFFADLDGMKQINDELGHAEGDRALRDVALILRDTFRDADIIGHLGGDEFVVLAVGSTDELGTVTRLEERIDRHNREAARRYRVSLSVGVARHETGSAETLDELLARADAEMYRVKQLRRAPR